MQSTMLFRMAQLQVMNMVNIGFSKNVSYENIETMAMASINATQLFLSDDEVRTLRQQLKERLWIMVQNNYPLH